MVNNIKAAQAELDATIEGYRIADPQSPADGLIDKADIDEATVQGLTAYYKHLQTASDVVGLLGCEDAAAMVANIAKTYRNQIWTGELVFNKPKGAGGQIQIVPKTTSPRSGINYTDEIISRVQKRLLTAWVSPTPTLQHEPDAKRFLELCRDLFPNVVNPNRAANAFRAFVENVHHSCGTEGAKHTQKAMWLYSLRIGGTGKSWLLEVIRRALVDMGVDAAYESFKDNGYLRPECGLHTVTISEDTPKLDTGMAETVNNLIDRSHFAYNIKWGASGLAKSSTTLIFGSNFESFESNSRRYNLVEYLGKNVEVAITDAERKQYFPLWGDEAKAVEEVKEAFKVAPFRNEHADWQTALDDDSRAVGTKFYTALERVQEAVEKYDEHIANGGTPDDDITKMRPTKMAKRMTWDGYLNLKDAKALLLNFLSELRAMDMLSGYDCDGRTPLQELRINWRKIAAMTCGAKLERSGNGDLFDIRKEWDGILANEF